MENTDDPSTTSKYFSMKFNIFFGRDSGSYEFEWRQVKMKKKIQKHPNIHEKFHQFGYHFWAWMFANKFYYFLSDSLRREIFSQFFTDFFFYYTGLCLRLDAGARAA